MNETLRHHFKEVLHLPDAATDWLLGVWNLIQVLDDVADGDPIERADLDRAVWDCLAGLPSNAFFQSNQAWLIPSCAAMVLKWQASDIAERAGAADERSYMWRAGYYDLVMMACAIIHGPNSEYALQALNLYGETAADYLKEFNRA